MTKDPISNNSYHRKLQVFNISLADHQNGISLKQYSKVRLDKNFNECYDWLQENFNDNWIWSRADNDNEYGIYFIYPEDAILFKLRF